MLRCLPFFLLLFACGMSFAQAVTYSILSNGAAVSVKTEAFVDSLIARASINRFSDSLTLNAWSDSLRKGQSRIGNSMTTYAFDRHREV